MSEKRLLIVSFLVKKIVFISPALEEQSKITVGVEFLSSGEQTLFEPIARPAEAGKTLNTDAGKTFSFGFDRGAVASLAKQFMMTISLHQTDPAKRLSDTKIDVTKKFRAAIEKSNGEVSNAQGKTTVEFLDEAGNSIAHLELIVRLTMNGTTAVSEYSTEPWHDANVQYMSGPDDRGLPSPPEFRCPRKPLGPNDGEWEIMGAELDNGQKIVVKYRRSYCQVKSTTGDNPCPPRPDDHRPSRTDRKHDAYLLKLMEQMHRMVVSNRAAT